VRSLHWLGRGWCKKGRRQISSTNRNFKGRMAIRALVYLGRRGFAASAIAGFICAPQTFAERAAGTAIRPPTRNAVRRLGRDHAGFPPSVRGRVSLLDKGQFKHHGIYGSKHTYAGDDMIGRNGGVTFENYDPNSTPSIAAVILWLALELWQWLHREQALRALKFKGISVCDRCQLFPKLTSATPFTTVSWSLSARLCDTLARHAKDRAPTTVASELRLITRDRS